MAKKKPKFDFSREAALTNQELAEEMAKLTPLTAAQIQKLLPTRVEKQQLATLIEIVNSAASQNNKIASLRKNLGQLGGVAMKILSTVLKVAT